MFNIFKRSGNCIDQQLFFSNAGEIRSVCFSPDGERYVTVGKDVAILRDAATGDEIRRFQDPSGELGWACRILNDEKTLVTLGLDRVIRYWNLSTGRLAKKSEINCWGGQYIVFMSDGNHFFTIQASGIFSRTQDVFTLFKTKPLKKIREYQGEQLRPLAVSADKSHVIVAQTLSHSCQLWDVATAKAIWSINLNDDGLAAAFLPDEKTVVVATENGEVLLLDRKSGKPLKTLLERNPVPEFCLQQIISFAISPDATELFFISHNGVLDVFSLPGGEHIGHQECQPRFAEAIFAPNGKRVAFIHDDSSVSIYDINKNAAYSLRFLSQSRGYQGAIRSVCFSPDDSRILIDDNGVARILETKDGRELFRLRFEADAPGMTFSPDGKLVLRSDRFYDAFNGTPENRVFIDWEGRNNWWYGLTVSKDGKRYVSLSGGSGRVWLRDIEEKQSRLLLGDERNLMQGSGLISFLSDDKRILVVWSIGTVHLIDIENGETKTWKDAEREYALAIAMSPNEKHLALSFEGYNDVTIYELESGKIISRFSDVREDVRSLAFSPDGRYLLGGVNDNTARLWNIEDGKCVQIFKGHKGPILAVAFSSDGARILTGSEDGTARLWKR